MFGSDYAEHLIKRVILLLHWFMFDLFDFCYFIYCFATAVIFASDLETLIGSVQLSSSSSPLPPCH